MINEPQHILMRLNSKSWRQTTISGLALLLLFVFACKPDSETVVLVEPGFGENRVSDAWLEALRTRQSKPYLDSLAQVARPLTGDEHDWFTLIQSRAARWNSFRDSLSIPFDGITLNDSIFVLTGYLGDDDGFTYQHRTICFDLTAFYDNYGAATSDENNSRIDRIFAHEYTHLLHKAWAKENNLTLKDFQDSILWECLYEGIGMYRSLSKKWTIQNDSLPAATREALDKVYPVFVERLLQIHQLENPTAAEKTALNKNLSRGNVDKKWGAFPVAVWLMLESKGDDKNLVRWIDGGPKSIPDLAKKYLPEQYRQKFQTAF
ncbi:MAG TPA: hypothetical protein PK325_15670 [Cyclobacteriaceae bacterium]|nr:hypothetical protein [Cyclobacteriaceae bacterium]HMV08724.1 hypothetical protein [Cyclobacteriaceae bacterium]HMV90060.1 hypothetical protein [Cyclobacteriaceae bacterium]HMW99869.1 hypothetical protein [Cyclobacteriaceae bacterium]HMX49268.1 hypothetical protein [Cyclobacteriaceae bacterium]